MKTLPPIVFSLFCLAGCMSSSSGEALRTDLFETKKRLLDLEAQINHTGSQGESTNKRMASTAVTLDKMNEDISKLSGQIAILREGIKTGRLPDAGEGDDSVAAKLDLLTTRMDALEKAQLDMLAILEKTSGKVNKESEKSGKHTNKDGLTSLKAVKEAYSKKSWNQIASETPALIAQAKKAKKSGEVGELTYYLSESLFRLGKLREAALNYQELLNASPSKSQKPKLQKRLGDCFRLLGDKSTAKIFYHELIDTFPESHEAKDAQGLLKGLE